MASPERCVEGIVLKKTKLGEADLIVSLLISDGSAERAVAKGARKPRNASSATLDVLNHVRLVIVDGKNLGIAKESRLLEHHGALQKDPARFAAACVIAEAAETSIQPELPVPRLFDMTCVALRAIADAPEPALALLVAAYIYKLTALLGMRPSFVQCAICGQAIARDDRTERFSFSDGGGICTECASLVDTIRASAATLRASDQLLRSTFADITQLASAEDIWDVLALAEQWIQAQMSARMRSFAPFKALGGCLNAQAVL